MTGPRLSPETARRVDALFDAADREMAALILIEECGRNLPFCDNGDEYSLERIRFAALKLSAGDLDGLLRAVDLAATDWRDLLMAAGFGEDVTAHERWMPGDAE